MAQIADIIYNTTTGNMGLIAKVNEIHYLKAKACSLHTMYNYKAACLFERCPLGGGVLCRSCSEGVN